MPQPPIVKDLKSAIHSYLALRVQAKPDDPIALREVCRFFRASYKRVVVVLKTLRSEGKIHYSVRDRAKMRLAVTVLKPSPVVGYSIQEDPEPEAKYDNSCALRNLNGTEKAPNSPKQPDLAAELKASFFSNLNGTDAQGKPAGDEKIENRLNSKPANNLNGTVQYSIYTTILYSGNNAELGTPLKRTENRKRKCRLKPPKRLSESEKFEHRARQVSTHELARLSEILQRLYRSVFRQNYWKLGGGSSRTCAQRIIQYCKEQHWDLEDYCRSQFDWFKSIGRRPYIANLWGDYALSRYENYLRSEGYTRRVSDDTVALDTESRNRDLRHMRATRARVEHDARHGLLYDQFIEKLDNHLERFRRKLTNAQIDKAATEVCASYPPWLRDSLTKEEIRERGISKAVSDEKLRLLDKWHQRNNERSHLEALVRLEMMTGKKSPLLAKVDLRAAGLSNWLIEEHEHLCLHGKADTHERV